MSKTYDLFQLGRSHLRSGRPAQATVSLEKAKRAEPKSRSIREALGIAYFRIGRWQEAEAEFRALVELSPDDEFAHYALGFEWMLAGLVGAALAPTDPAVMFSVLGRREIAGRSELWCLTPVVHSTSRGRE